MAAVIATRTGVPPMTTITHNDRLDHRLRCLSIAALFSAVALLAACGPETHTVTERTTTRQIIPAPPQVSQTTTTTTQQTTP